MDRFTRRRFVSHGATIAGAASATALLGGTPVGRALAASATGALSEARRKTYSAVVESVALSKTSTVEGRNVEATTRRFAALYRKGDADFRTAVDNVLDRVEEGAGNGGFSALGPHARLKLLRRWAQDDGGVRGIGRGVLASAASQYAAIPFQRSTDEPSFGAQI